LVLAVSICARYVMLCVSIKLLNYLKSGKISVTVQDRDMLQSGRLIYSSLFTTSGRDNTQKRQKQYIIMFDNSQRISMTYDDQD